MTAPLDYLADEVAALREQGVFHWPRLLESEQAPVAVYDGKRIINLCSNNYLGLANHPKLEEAAAQAIRDYGVGSGAVRTIAGNLKIHQDLEERLADFKKVEAVLLFQSGFTANAGTVSAILGPDDVVVSDRLNHASIIDGCRLSKAKIRVFEHADVEGARGQVKEATEEAKGRVLLITDGVFSMDGDVAPLPGLVEVAEEFGAIMMVDDAHASGVMGERGRGTVDHYQLHGRVDIQVGTLSKALACLGGYVAGSRTLIEYLMNRGRPILFSTSHPPPVAASAIAALDLIEGDPSIIERLWENTDYLKRGLNALGLDTGASETPITPVMVGDERKAMALSRRLFEEGVFATGIVYPTVPKGAARVRTIVTAGHTKEQLDDALAVFAKVGDELGLG